MNEVLVFALPLMWPVFAGGVLGTLFFVGLWWTVRKTGVSTQYKFWLLVSLFLRFGLVLGGFYLVAGTNWQRGLACLLGFFLARVIVVKLLGGCCAHESR